MDDEHNPDFNLALIHAANMNFQSKIDIECRSYLLTEFNIKNNKKK